MPAAPSRLLITLLWLTCQVATTVGAEEVTTILGQERRFTATEIEFFEKQIRPLFIERCYECHSSDAKELKAAFSMDTRQQVVDGGESGPAVVVGKPEESSLVAAVRYEANEMPPDGKLSDREIEAIAKWVEMGAPWPQATVSSVAVPKAQEIDWEQARANHWAWRPIVKPALPATQYDDTQAPNAIDRFVLRRREIADITPNRLASPRVLVRRIYLDLIGIPPTLEQASTFQLAASQNRQRAVQDLVDQLLASPLYGQRWARHWLDVARYSDGRGGFLDSDAFDDAWRYRDWIVDALNRDQPIDDFIRLQIAGDLIAGDVVGNKEDVVATGFLALGPTYRSDGGDPDSTAQAKSETLDDRVDTLSRGLLGITASCSRCHDHKFDPIPQLDYYSLAGVFNNTATHRRPLDSDEVVEQFNHHRDSLKEVENQIKQLDQLLGKEKREPTEQEQANRDEWVAKRDKLKRNAPSPLNTAHVLREAGEGDMHLAVRGNLRKTGPLAPRRFLRILHGSDPPKFTRGSGRVELAEAIVDAENPLTPRVFVNRIWRQHFGAGLVRTPSNFGKLGQPPTHPELLDWLAADFIEHGWSLKRLHRQIMTSLTYQLSSQFEAAAHEQDGDNRWLWRMQPRRMEVEAWRDSLLSVCGELDTTPAGPSIDNIAGSRRRTLYAKVSRNGDVFSNDTFLRRFDFPLMRATVAKRPTSIVPQQYLFLLNSEFMVQRSEAFVARLHAEADNDTSRLELAYRLLYSRPPQREELEIGRSFLAQAGVESTSQLSAWQQYAQVLLSSNEFMFVR